MATKNKLKEVLQSLKDEKKLICKLIAQTDIDIKHLVSWKARVDNRINIVEAELYMERECVYLVDDALARYVGIEGVNFNKKE
jgi:hypothetical protein